MAIRRESTIRNPQSPMPLPWWAPMMCVAGVLWLMLWAGINTGPWVFRRTPEGLREGVHYVRTALESTCRATTHRMARIPVTAAQVSQFNSAARRSGSPPRR